MHGQTTTAGVLGLILLGTLAIQSDPIRIDQHRSADLTGDGNPEQITLTAEGPSWSDLAVHLVITSPTGDTLLTDTWDSRMYFHYVGESLTATKEEELVRRGIQLTMGDQDSLQAVMRGNGHRLGEASEIRNAVTYDLMEVASPGWARGAKDPADYRSRASAARAKVSDARIEALTRELEGRPMFLYFKGGEIHVGVAWSAQEGRFVQVYSCC